MCDNKGQLNEQSSFIHDTTFIQNQKLLNNLSKQQEKQIRETNLTNGMKIDNTAHKSFRTIELSQIEELKNEITRENISSDMKQYQEVYERMIKLYGVVSTERYNTLTKTEQNQYFG